jgi:CDGSH-type Zn-finger protein
MGATKITIRTDGPIRVEGEFVLVDAEGREFGLAGRTAISLCRCGHSQSKPFCDGSHRTAAFRHQAEACNLPPSIQPRSQGA